MSRELPPLEQFEIEKQGLKKLNRRKFLMWMASAMAGGAGFYSLYQSEYERGLREPLRKMMNLSDSFWQESQDPNKKSPTEDPPQSPARINGNVGIINNIQVENWRLRVIDSKLSKPFEIRFQDILALPAVTETFEFKCIEGWSQVMSFKGVRFSDFMNAYQVGFQDREKKDPYAYAGLITVDEEYYVSMDSKSLQHDQTLLCYEMNGEPLTIKHGYPLRLVTAVKYGVKSLKQIGTIAFSNELPDDYWAEEGYGDFLGL